MNAVKAIMTTDTFLKAAIAINVSVRAAGPDQNALGEYLVNYLIRVFNP
jgi:hypothetical protein